MFFLARDNQAISRAQLPPLINQPGVVDAPDSQLLHGCRAVSVSISCNLYILLLSSITDGVISNVTRVVDAVDPSHPIADIVAMSLVWTILNVWQHVRGVSTEMQTKNVADVNIHALIVQFRQQSAPHVLKVSYSMVVEFVNQG